MYTYCQALCHSLKDYIYHRGLLKIPIPEPFLLPDNAFTCGGTGGKAPRSPVLPAIDKNFPYRESLLRILFFTSLLSTISNSLNIKNKFLGLPQNVLRLFSILLVSLLLPVIQSSVLSGQEGPADSPADQKIISQLESEDSPAFISDTGKPDYVDALSDIIAIGSYLARTLAANNSNASYHGKYLVEYVPSTDPARLGSDIFSLSESAGVNHIRNLRHILAGYLRGRYGYSAAVAATISISLTNYNAFYRNNMQYVEQKFAPAVAARLNVQSLGLSTSYAEWPGRTQMLIPLKPLASTGARPEIELTELSREAQYQYGEAASPSEQIQTEQAPETEEPTAEPVLAVTKNETEQSGTLAWLYALLALLLTGLLLAVLVRMRLNKRNIHKPEMVVNTPHPLKVPEAGPLPPIFSRYFPGVDEAVEALIADVSLRRVHERIEVPYDQYQDILERLNEQIRQGKIFHGIASGTELLCRGSLTYHQARNISRSARIVGLSFDEQSQVVQSSSEFGISCLGQFAAARWNGVAQQQALRISILEELIGGGISLCEHSGRLADKDHTAESSNHMDNLLEAFPLLSCLLVDYLYKAADYGKDVVCHVASTLLGKDLKGAAAKNYLATVLRSHSFSELAQMPLRLQPRFAPLTLNEWLEALQSAGDSYSGTGHDDMKNSGSEYAGLYSPLSVKITKKKSAETGQLPVAELCTGIDGALRQLMEDYCVTAAQYHRQIEPVLSAGFDDPVAAAEFLQQLAPNTTGDEVFAAGREGFVYRHFEPAFADFLDQSMALQPQDEQLRAEQQAILELSVRSRAPFTS